MLASGWWLKPAFHVWGPHEQKLPYISLFLGCGESGGCLISWNSDGAEEEEETQDEVVWRRKGGSWTDRRTVATVGMRLILRGSLRHSIGQRLGKNGNGGGGGRKISKGISSTLHPK